MPFFNSDAGRETHEDGGVSGVDVRRSEGLHLHARSSQDARVFCAANIPRACFLSRLTGAPAVAACGAISIAFHGASVIAEAPGTSRRVAPEESGGAP